jgi:hypothetical protein
MVPVQGGAAQAFLFALLKIVLSPVISMPRPGTALVSMLSKPPPPPEKFSTPLSRLVKKLESLEPELLDEVSEVELPLVEELPLFALQEPLAELLPTAPQELVPLER